MQGRSLTFLLLLLSLHGVLCLPLEINVDDVLEAGSSCHFPVTAPVVPDSAEERREHYRAMEAKDLLRHRQMITSETERSGGTRRQARESSKLPEVMSDTSMFELPMRSAINIAHVGMYLVSVRFGTPALPYNLVLDTATDLTWINCRLRRRGGKHYGRPHVARSPTVNVLSLDGEGSAPVKVAKNWYRPARSSSWRRFRCAQRACAALPYNTCESANRSASCSYAQTVQDGTTTSGIYGQEKATVSLSGGRMAKLPGLILGCSTFEAGGSVDSHDGVLALGNSDMSFGVHAARRFGARFSFCLLGTHSGRNASSYLTFGSNPAANGPGTMETRLIFNPDMVAFGARVTCVTVAGELLDIPPEVWDDAIVGAGMVIDTGTSVTGLAPPAYAQVTKALDRYLGHLQRVTNIAGFEFCYNWTFAGDGVDPAHNVTVPRFTVELEGGARLEPDAKSVVIPEVVPGVACLAFRRLPSGPGIFGNVLMQEYMWEFDHINEKLRFRKDKCTTHDTSNHHP